MDSSTGNTGGRSEVKGGAVMVAKSKRAQAQNDATSTSPVLDTLSLLQDDLSQYRKQGGMVAIVPKDGILAILVYPVDGVALGFDRDTGHITANGKPVTYA